MEYAYAHLIPENVAPFGATEIIIKNASEKEVAHVPLGGLTQPAGELLLRYIVLSDIHMDTDSDDAKAAAFKRVLEYANEDEACKFTVICGDLVDNGLTKAQRDNYEAIVEATAKKPVYAIAGNHDTIWGYPTDEHMESYTGKPHYYAVANTDTIPQPTEGIQRVFANPDVPATDLLIFLGHYGKDHSGGNGDWRGGEQFSAAELTWLEGILAANTDKSCMIFIHPYIPGGAGNPPVVKETSTDKSAPPNLWTKNSSVSTDAGAEFLAILSRYPGAHVYNGHSHYRFRTQEEESKAIIYKPADGSYTSIHIPSPTKLRDVRNKKRIDLEDGSGEFAVVDRYGDCTHVRGMTFEGTEAVPVPVGTYRLNT